jgi:ABC-type oligopeptide transport system ATPase subunit
MKNLQIIVAGETASGKSTMALLLERFFIENGFEVEMKLENDVHDYGSEKNFREKFNSEFVVRKELLKQNTKVVVSQLQVVDLPKNGCLNGH